MTTNGDYEEGRLKFLAEQAARDAAQPIYQEQAQMSQAIRLTLSEVRDLKREARQDRKINDAVTKRMSADLAEVMLAVLKGERRDATQDLEIEAAQARANEARRAASVAQERLDATTGNTAIAAVQRQQSESDLLAKLNEVTIHSINKTIDVDADMRMARYVARLKITVAVCLAIITFLAGALSKGYIK